MITPAFHSRMRFLLSDEGGTRELALCRNHLNADSEVSQYNRHIHMAGSLIHAAYTCGSSGPIMASASIFRAIP
jgi:hypothetical protein